MCSLWACRFHVIGGMHQVGIQGRVGDLELGGEMVPVAITAPMTFQRPAQPRHPHDHHNQSGGGHGLRALQGETCDRG